MDFFPRKLETKVFKLLERGIILKSFMSSNTLKVCFMWLKHFWPVLHLFFLPFKIRNINSVFIQFLKIILFSQRDIFMLEISS